MKIKMYQAGPGDCVRLQWNYGEREVCNLIVDTGTDKSYETGFRQALTEIEKDGQVLDLLIISHYDTDHLGGILKYFEEEDDHSLIKKVFFNSKKVVEDKELLPSEAHYEKIKKKQGDASKEDTDTGVKEALQLSKELKNSDIEVNEIPFSLNQHFDYVFNGALIRCLSPRIENFGELFRLKEGDSNNTGSNAKDYAISVKDHVDTMWTRQDEEEKHVSSASFILEVGEKKFLYLSDNVSNVVADELELIDKNIIQFHGVKLSHHGSKRNLNKALLDKIKSEQFFISSDGSQNGHPHKQTLSKIIGHNTKLGIQSKFYFNYEIFEDIFSSDDLEQFDIIPDLNNELQNI